MGNRFHPRSGLMPVIEHPPDPQFLKQEPQGGTQHHLRPVPCFLLQDGFLIVRPLLAEGSVFGAPPDIPDPVGLNFFNQGLSPIQVQIDPGPGQGELFPTGNRVVFIV